MEVKCPSCGKIQEDWSYLNKCTCGREFSCRVTEEGKLLVEPKQ